MRLMGEYHKWGVLAQSGKPLSKLAMSVTAIANSGMPFWLPALPLRNLAEIAVKFAITRTLRTSRFVIPTPAVSVTMPTATFVPATAGTYSLHHDGKNRQ